MREPMHIFNQEQKKFQSVNGVFNLNDYLYKYKYIKELHHIIFGRESDDNADEMI